MKKVSVLWITIFALLVSSWICYASPGGLQLGKKKISADDFINKIPIKRIQKGTIHPNSIESGESHRMNQRSRLFSISCLTVLSSLACGSSTRPQDNTPAAVPLDGRGGGVIVYCYQPIQNGLHQIYGINADGTGNKKMIHAQIGLNHHDVSMDGKRIVAVGYVDQATWSIYSFNSNGTNLTRLTTLSGVNDSEPVWSPDGSRIAFTRIYPNQNNRQEIWVMNADGSNQAYTGIDGFAARWSPDGTKFIYINTPTPGGSNLYGVDIWTCSIDGTETKQLTNTTGDEWFPSWSPDGSRIVFGYTSDGKYENNEIFVMNSDGTGRIRLTDNTAWDNMARWSPDGSQIVFESDRSAHQNWEVYIMNADGDNIRRITNSPSGITAVNPVWVPFVVESRKGGSFRR